MRRLSIQVLIGILFGVLMGLLLPSIGLAVKPLADIFIKLIKMMITPIIFFILVSGLASIADIKTAGKIGGISLIYFLLTTTLALFIGLIVANIFHPGQGMHIDPTSLDIGAAQSYLGDSEPSHGLMDLILHIIPTTFFSAFVSGNILQVLFVSILFALGLMSYGSQGKSLLENMDHLAKICIKIIHALMYYAPIAAFAAIAYTVSQYGIHSLVDLASLLVCFYLSCALFIFIILGGILHFYCHINVFKLINYIKTEIFIVFATSSSESVLPNLLEKLVALGCDKKVVGLVIPTGYSFNLDGTAIYLTLAALFIAQATNYDLTMSQQVFLLVVMIISSKGAAGVAGSGFIILASSLSTLNTIPVAGVVIILGIERFMSAGRSLTNMIGNTIATVILSKWHGALDLETAKTHLNTHQKLKTIA